MKVQQIERKFPWLLTLGALVLLAVAVFAANGTRPAQALGESLNVAVVGSSSCTSGGGFPTSGGAFNSFVFTPVAPALVNSATLALYDTVLLNVCSPQMLCNPNTLTPAAKAALVTFVGNGGKLIVYDSECAAFVTPRDYTWLPYQFTTTWTPTGSPLGTLTIEEENVLSTTPLASTYYIDAASMSVHSEVGDANFMTTLDPHWCLDMSGTRVNGDKGPVHTYARYQSGLMIYNGLDVDTELTEATPPAPNGLQRVWLQELQVPLTPTFEELPCGAPSITICKQTDPAGPSPGFTFGGGTSSFSVVPFVLNDNGCKTLPGSTPDTYFVGESALLLPPGWTLTNIVCTGGSPVGFFASPDPISPFVGPTRPFFTQGDNSVRIDLGSGDNVTCTFFNCLRGQTPTPTPMPEQEDVERCRDVPVGGVAALTVSSSGSPFPWTPLVAAAALAVLGVGIWYGRRRWLS